MTKLTSGLSMTQCTREWGWQVSRTVDGFTWKVSVTSTGKEMGWDSVAVCVGKAAGASESLSASVLSESGPLEPDTCVAAMVG